jgi:hypothetical protein
MALQLVNGVTVTPPADEPPPPPPPPAHAVKIKTVNDNVEALKKIFIKYI